MFDMEKMYELPSEKKILDEENMLDNLYETVLKKVEKGFRTS